MTVWVVGTSVSLGRGGYVDQLRESLSEEIDIINLAVGDQTSMMGFVRLSQYLHEVRSGDLLIWEYGLLDILLSDFFGLDLSLTAMGDAWTLASGHGARIVCVNVAPRAFLAKEGVIEAAVVQLMRQYGLHILSTRDIGHDLGITESSTHYIDDRHIEHASPIISTLVTRLREFVLDSSKAGSPNISGRAQLKWDDCEIATVSPHELRIIETHENSAMSVPAIHLSPDVHVISTPGDILATVVISTHASGALWCGHQLCPPVSTRLPTSENYKFLLRTTRIPCVRGHYETLRAAPPHAFATPSWQDYGQAPTGEPADVFLVGFVRRRK